MIERLPESCLMMPSTLQRSNEQLVKLCTLMSKNDNDDELTDKDFEGIFDAIQKSEDKDADK